MVQKIWKKHLDKILLNIDKNKTIKFDVSASEDEKKLSVL